MRRSDLLLEFLDGTLEDGAEQRLFDELAARPEFREELRSHFAISAAVHADREAFSPPGEVEQQLFAGLGLLPLIGSLDQPAADAPQEVPPAVSAPVPASFRQTAVASLTGMLPLIAAFVLGGLITGGLWLIAGGAEEQSPRGIVTGEATFEPAVPEPQQMAEAVVDAVLQTPPAVSTGGPAVPRSTDIGSAQPPAPGRQAAVVAVAGPEPEHRRVENPESALELSQPQFEPVDNVLLADIALRAVVPAAIDSIGGEPQFSRASSPLQPASLSTSRPSPISIELRHQISGQLHQNNPLPVEPSLLENTIGGVYWNIDERSAIGLEAGHERFAQTFIQHVNDTIMQVEQMPALTWVGASMRYSMSQLDLLPATVPYAQLTIGGSEGGPIGRLRTGLRWSPLERLSINGAVEGSAITYQLGGRSYSSMKLGITLGGEVRL